MILSYVNFGLSSFFWVHSIVLNLTVYVRNIISLQPPPLKKGENPMYSILLVKNSILAYISLKIANLGEIGNYDVILTSYTVYL